MHIDHSVSDGHLDMPTAVTFTSDTPPSDTPPSDTPLSDEPMTDDKDPSTSGPIVFDSTAPTHVTEPGETPEGSSGPSHTTGEEEVTPSPPR